MFSELFRGKGAWLIVIIIIIAVVLGGAFFHFHEDGRGNEINDPSPSGYSAVYLTSGDILIGKLSFSPSPTLANVWILAHGANQANQNQLNLVPFKTTIVSPEDEIHIEPQQMLFWANLQSSSSLMKQLMAESPQ